MNKEKEFWDVLKQEETTAGCVRIKTADPKKKAKQHVLNGTLRMELHDS